jgi:hypothetical protein
VFRTTPGRQRCEGIPGCGECERRGGGEEVDLQASRPGAFYTSIEDEEDMKVFLVKVEIQGPGRGFVTVGAEGTSYTTFFFVEVHNGAWCISV